MKKILICSLSSLLLSTGIWAQDFKMPAASPSSTLTQQFSTSRIEVDYSRPSMKGRKIFGTLVPYGHIWRTGANANTKITFGEEVIIEGQKLAAGTYSVYTVPNKDSWEIIFNKGLENWGTAGYNKEEDAIRVKVKPLALKDVHETFTIEITDITNTSAILSFIWENTKVPVKITADNHQRILSYLDAELKGNKPPYQQAANYYLENNYKLDQALTYTEKAIAENKEAFWLHWLKARILAKLGNKSEALSEATKAAEMSKGTGFESDYVNNLETLKKELK